MTTTELPAGAVPLKVPGYNAPKFIQQTDGPDYSLASIAWHGVWSYMGHAHGWGYLIDPQGELIHSDTIQLHDDTEAGEVMRFINENY